MLEHLLVGRILVGDRQTTDRSGCRLPHASEACGHTARWCRRRGAAGAKGPSDPGLSPGLAGPPRYPPASRRALKGPSWTPGRWPRLFFFLFFLVLHTGQASHAADPVLSWNKLGHSQSCQYVLAPTAAADTARTEDRAAEGAAMCPLSLLEWPIGGRGAMPQPQELVND